MTQWVIKHNVQIVPRRKMWGLTPDELVHDLEVKKRAKFDASTKFRYGDSITLTKKMRGYPQEADDTYNLTFDEVAPNIPKADIIDDQGKLLHPTPATYISMNSEVLLHQGEELRLGQSDTKDC